MGGAPGFDGQPCQKQENGQTKNRALLFCQEIHNVNIQALLKLFKG
jgi:hypothetical protein